MEIKHINSFRAVYQERSLSRAAKSLFISQQALSKQMAALEQELGVTLFERTSAGMEPTALGTFLFEDTERLVREYDEALARFEEAKRAVGSQVTLCVEKGLLRNRPDAMPAIVQECAASTRHPFRLIVDDLDGDECRIDVQSGARSLGLVVSSGGADVGEHAAKLTDVKVFLALKRDHPLAAKEVLTPSDIASISMPVPNEVTRAWIDTVLADYGCSRPPQFVPQARDTMNLDGFVLTYCDGVLSWQSLLFEGTREKLHFYSVGKVGLYLMRSPFFYDDKAVEVLREALAPYLPIV